MRSCSTGPSASALRSLTPSSEREQFSPAVPSSDPTTRFAARLDRAIVDAERAGLNAGTVCDHLAHELVDRSVRSFGIAGARRGFQVLLIGLARRDAEESAPRLGGVAFGSRTVAVGRRKF